MQGLIAGFQDRPLIQRAALLVLLGVIAGLGQAPFGWWWASIAALAVLFALYETTPNPMRGFATLWWVGVGYFGFTLRWIVEPFLVDAASTGWMAPFAIVLMAAGAAVFWGLAGYAAAKVGPLALAVALVLTEATRSLILTGFPWALIGHIWIDTPLAQLAAFVGPHGLTALACLLAWSIGFGVRSALPAWTLATIGWVIVNPGPVAETDGPLIRLVQPNVPQHEKWDPIKREENFERLLGLTSAGDRPELIVWPETAIPVLMNFADDQIEQAADAAAGVPLIFGINRQEGARYYNAAVHLGLGAEVRAVYDKTHLAPFGEYIPGGEWLQRFGITGLAASTGGAFSTGGVQPLMDIPGIGTARMLICYEGIFAEEVGHSDRPRLMVLITNDAWFGNGAGPAQHLAQARLRAIEQGLPMARAANTGISAMIDAKGRLVAALPLNRAGALDVALPPAGSATVYSRVGDWPVLALAILSLALMILMRRRNS